MSQKQNSRTVPLTFDVAPSLIEKLEARRKAQSLASVSELVRAALEEFDFSAVAEGEETKQQLSVRLPNALKASLTKAAKKKGVSNGCLIRLALEAFIAKPAKKAKR